MSSNRGFSLIELVVVLTVMVLLTVCAAPALSQFVKTSKVDLAARQVCSALWMASGDAQRLRKHVAVVYGDDWSHVAPAPSVLNCDQANPGKFVPGALTPTGQLEIWQVVAGQEDLGAGRGAYAPELSGTPDWYPFRYLDRKLAIPVTLPDNIRVVAGNYVKNWYENFGRFTFTNYQKTATGEFKRHNSVYTSNGATNGWWDECSYNAVLVFDPATGENLAITIGSWYTRARPQILGSVSAIGNGPKLGKLSELQNQVDQYPSN